MKRKIRNIRELKFRLGEDFFKHDVSYQIFNPTKIKFDDKTLFFPFDESEVR